MTVHDRANREPTEPEPWDGWVSVVSVVSTIHHRDGPWGLPLGKTSSQVLKESTQR